MLPDYQQRFHSLPGTWLVSNPSQSKPSIKHGQTGERESSFLTFTSRPSDIKPR
jgi:hypothetical protein